MAAHLVQQNRTPDSNPTQMPANFANTVNPTILYAHRIPRTPT
jgi:hypothetical protein